MEYTSRTVQSAPDLSQEEALLSLYDHPQFKRGTRVASIRRKGDIWVAKLMEPKVAEFPPQKGGEDPEGPSDEEAPDGPDDDASDDGDEGAGPKPPSEKKPKKDGEGEVIQLLHVLLDALGISPGGGPPGAGGPGGPPPGAGGPPPSGPPPGHGGPPPGAGGPPGGPGGAPAGQPYGSKLKPGEVPNRPGFVPVGAPSFGSTKQADGLDPALNPLDPNQQQGGLPPQPGMPPQPGQGQPPNPLLQGMPQQQGQIPGQPPVDPNMPQSFVASTEDPQKEVKLVTAKVELEQLYGPGYRVAQIRREAGSIKALLTIK